MYKLITFSTLLLCLWSCDSSEDSANSNEDSVIFDEMAVCNPSEKRCNGNKIQSCNLQGQWENIECPIDYSCFLVNNEPSCDDRNQGGVMPMADMNVGGNQGGVMPMADMMLGGNQGGVMPMADMMLGGNQGGVMPMADMMLGGNQGGVMPMADMNVGGNQGGVMPMADMMLVEMDLDGDGITVLEGDCDDSNANIYPNAPEIFGDQIDQDCDQLADVEDGVCEASFTLKVGDNPELILDGCRSWEVDLNYEYDPDTTPKINGGVIKFKATTERNFECDLTLEFTSLSCSLDQVYQIGSTLNISDCSGLADQYEGSYHINPDQGLIVSFSEINTGNQRGNFSGAPLFTQISGHVGTLNQNGITLSNQQGSFQSYLYGSFSISSIQMRDDAEQNFNCNQNSDVTVYDFDGDGESSFVYGYENHDCDDLNPTTYSSAPEFCNGIDDNCNGIQDDGLLNCCGDGVTNGDEQCDDSNDINTDGCTNTCALAICGDGFIQIDVEQCDDGNDVNTDGCTNTCALAICGDGFIQIDVEQCDDGDDLNTDECTNLCKSPTCGDGFIQIDVEQCDDGNDVNTDGCTNTCALAICGDGFIQIDVEQCDDGDDLNTDECTNLCKSPTCGDGFIQIDVEQCDDGNDVNTDGCTNTCALAICGDGFIQIDVEQCDDGNDLNTDECTNLCKSPTCGDGFVQVDVEQCDDGNDINTDECTNLCKSPTCGDGFVQVDVEQCDDGNDINIDGCTNTCALASCGDGLLNGSETCDDGNLMNGDGCSETCTVELRCGDSLVRGSEECDDGNTTSGDGCGASCVSEAIVIESRAQVLSYQGALTANDNLWTRPYPNCLPNAQANVYRDVYRFVNNSSDLLFIDMESSWLGDGYLYLFSDQPNDQFNSIYCIEANDNLNGDFFKSGISNVILSPGQSLVVIATAFDPNRTIAQYTLTLRVQPMINLNYCKLQFPTSITVNDQVRANAPVMVYGQVYHPGITDITTGLDGGLLAQVGYGPRDSHPLLEDDLWQWSDAQGNPNFNGVGLEANNDEYIGALTFIEAGQYDYAYRFSGDQGRSWIYCDPNGNERGNFSNGYDVESAAKAEVLGPLGKLVINEVDYDNVGADGAEFIELYNLGTTSVSLNNLWLVIVNGTSSAAVVGQYNLTSFTEILPGEYMVAKSNTSLASIAPNTRIIPIAATLQNDNEVVLIEDRNTNPPTIVDIITYEAAVTGYIQEGFTTAVDSTVNPGDLSRCPNGRDTNQNGVDFSFVSTLSAGSANICQ